MHKTGAVNGHNITNGQVKVAVLLVCAPASITIIAQHANVAAIIRLMRGNSHATVECVRNEK